MWRHVTNLKTELQYCKMSLQVKQEKVKEKGYIQVKMSEANKAQTETKK